jgi:thymidylate kinase
MQGHVIIFDGASSAGKTSVIKTLIPLLDESYRYIAVDDFVNELFVQQQNNPQPYEKFLAHINKQCDRMYTHIRTSTKDGYNVLLDTVLSGLEGEKSVHHTFKKLEGLTVYTLLIHCPLRLLITRIQQRNMNAQQANKPEEVRSFGLPLQQFGYIYRAFTTGDTINLGTLSKADVVCALDTARHEWGNHQKQFETFKIWLLHQLELVDKEMVSLTPRLNYNYIIDTSKYSPDKAARKINVFLKGSLNEKN